MKRIILLFCISVFTVALAGCAVSSEDSDPLETAAEIVSAEEAERETGDEPGTQETEAEYEERANPDIDRTGGYEIETEELTIEDEDGNIYAVLYRPTGVASPRPAVIFSHGYGDTNQGGSQYAQAFASQGYLVCCFDFRGGGTGSKSDGSPLEMSIFTEQKDLETVFVYIKERSDVDSRRIFLMGNSQGGVVTAITASEYGDEIAGVMLASPAFSLVDDAQELFGSADAVPETYFHMIMTVGRPYFADLFGYDIYAAIRNYEGDVLILHGDRDNLVPISYSEQAIEVLPSAELQTLSGEGHIYSNDGVQLVIETCSDFLYEHTEGGNEQ